ncbi:MAG TPA: serine/threonine-protein kinase [Steroidobacteraceae bacterium]|jgi:eukaryotic-like serine/threonine-protein kinase|nr:serine/threonine-protein kinase [Steroidobacteraceae bacterium]
MRPSTEETLVLMSTGGQPAVAMPAGPPPAMLGRYQILNEIGKGAMGVVYRARDPMINREVALKAIPLADEFEGRELEEARGRFFREAEMAGRLSHPHIVTIFDAGEHDGTAYIAMELLRGRHLVEHTQPERLLPVAVALDLVGRLADALHFAHQRQVVHRDIKPANVMYDPSGADLKITDFGIARLTDSARTRTGVVLGTPSFMSPEQLQGREVTGRSDLFSLAVTLYQLLTAQLPFRADSMPELMLKIVQDPHPRIRAIRPDLPEKLDAFFERALGKDPADRFESGAAFAAALRQIGGTLRD